MSTYNAGIVTAYGAAVLGGYTGTYAEFCAQQAGFAENAEIAQEAAQTAQSVLDSIPSDYSTLSAQVATNTDDISDIKQDLSQLSGLSEDVKVALLQIARKVAYIDAQGQTYYDELYDALYAVTAIRLDANSIMLTSIGSTQQLTATTTPAGGAVTWASSNTSIASVGNTGLVTSVGYGSCTITASSGSVSASCAVAVITDYTITNNLTNCTNSNSATTITTGESYTATLTASTYYSLNEVTVTMGGEDITSSVYTSGTISIPSVTGSIVITATAVLVTESITATYTQSGTVYDDASLSDLTSDLVVVATYADSSTSTLSSDDYELSGTLTVGTSTITVTYGGKTTTFTVTVSESYVSDGLFAFWDAIDNTGSTHDASATTWVDKINGYTWEAMKTDSTKTWAWDTDGLVFSPETTGSSGMTQGKNTFKCTRPGTDLRTLEIVFSTDTADAQCLGEFTSNSSGISDTNTQIIALVSSDNTFITQGTQSSSFSAGSLSNIKSITATYNASKVPQKAYMNGSEVTTRGSSHSFKYHFYNNLILGAQNNSANLIYPFKGTIHAIRMYSKELTAEEIAQNYDLDVSRFGLGV